MKQGQMKLAGDFAGAIADLDLALQLEPKNALALSCRGDAKRRLGDFPGAMADFNVALELEPKDAVALRGRGEAKRMLDDFAGMDSLWQLGVFHWQLGVMI